MNHPEAAGTPIEPGNPTEQPGAADTAQVDRDDPTEQAERRREAAPRIWVGSWLDYNSGRLHGQWIDADQDDAAISADITAMLAASPTTAHTGEPAEDWGIFDFDNFGDVRISEQDRIDWIGAVGRGIGAHGPAFAAYASSVDDLDGLTGFEDDYLGQWPSVEAYADSFAADAGYNQLLDAALPTSIRGYVRLDTEAIARDMQLAGDIHATPDGQGGLWLFSSR